MPSQLVVIVRLHHLSNFPTSTLTLGSQYYSTPLTAARFGNSLVGGQMSVLWGWTFWFVFVLCPSWLMLTLSIWKLTLQTVTSPMERNSIGMLLHLLYKKSSWRKFWHLQSHLQMEKRSPWRLLRLTLGNKTPFHVHGHKFINPACNCLAGSASSTSSAPAGLISRNIKWENKCSVKQCAASTWMKQPPNKIK